MGGTLRRKCLMDIQKSDLEEGNPDEFSDDTACKIHVVLLRHAADNAEFLQGIDTLDGSVAMQQ